MSSWEKCSLWNKAHLGISTSDLYQLWYFWNNSGIFFPGKHSQCRRGKLFPKIYTSQRWIKRALKTKKSKKSLGTEMRQHFSIQQRSKCCFVQRYQHTGREEWAVGPLPQRPLHQRSQQREWTMQNHTYKIKAAHGGSVYDMDGRVSSCYRKLQKWIAVFCSFAPMSALAGEIWMDRL